MLLCCRSSCMCCELYLPFVIQLHVHSVLVDQTGNTHCCPPTAVSIGLASQAGLSSFESNAAFEVSDVRPPDTLSH